MKIHEPAADRIKDGIFSGEHFYNLLEDMAAEAEKEGMESYHLCISYIEEKDTFVQGTYVPEIHLLIRKVDERSDSK